MTKYLILLAIIVALYLYWKYQQKTLPKPEDVIERKGKSKEVFWETTDLDLSDQESINSADD